MKIYLSVLVLISVNLVSAQTRKSIQPQIFQEGIISKGDYESHGAFSPSCDTLYFIKTSNDLKVSAICVSYFRNHKWTEPIVAYFSGKYMDADPFVTNDGQAIYFMSNRPVKGNGPPKSDTDIWKVVLTANGWSQPIHLDAPVNSDADEYYPTLADNSTIYFGSPRKGGKGGSDIYRCRLMNGKYQKAENLGAAINGIGNEYECYIAPDESFLIYNSTPKDLSGLDFYMSYNRNGIWTKAKRLPEPLNSDGIEWAPKVTPDKRIFYFGSTRSKWIALPSRPENIKQFNKRLQSAGNGLGDIYTVDFNAIINRN